MFDFNSAKATYDATTDVANKLFTLNAQVAQSCLNLQTTIATEALNFALSSVAKTSEIKTPKELEAAIKEKQSEFQDLAVNNSKKYLQVYKDYAEGVSGLVAGIAKDSVKAAKTTAK